MMAENVAHGLERGVSHMHAFWTQMQARSKAAANRGQETENGMLGRKAYPS